MNKEANQLYRVYLNALELATQREIIDLYHMTENHRLASVLHRLICNLEDYNNKYGIHAINAAEMQKIKESYDFLKNKNSVSLQEAK